MPSPGRSGGRRPGRRRTWRALHLDGVVQGAMTVIVIAHCVVALHDTYVQSDDVMGYTTFAG